MPQKYIRKTLENVTTANTCYTVPASNVGILTGLTLANKGAANAVANVFINTTTSNSDTYIAFNVNILPGSTLVVVGGENTRLFMEASDILRIQSTASVDAYASIIEVTV